ncbi:hypothetical protein OHB05_41000 [Streptomyces sp. NBC_00638]|uniref:hypothetical protein n=1 Tax=Streptomyces sp. NBC_00638 TaxID=2975794 RepID=UPI00225A1759|nr:hypothetical protein [Streptomyces sp. NBC_00638]MCX5008905.1 hypothetical protein [Streptomyces sp. NBC_00638]
MSSPVAYPVFRTTDPLLALRVARQLVAVGDQQYAEVTVDVELCTVPEVLRMGEALPDAWFRKEDVEDWARDPSDPTGLHGGVHAPELSSDPEFLASHLPLWASMECRAVDSVEEEFAALVGPNIGEIWWSSLIWPDVPDRGIPGEANNARVSLLFNCRTQSLDERSDDHTVLVHVRRGNRDGSEERHALWLAEQIGQSVIGPPQE